MNAQEQPDPPRTFERVEPRDFTPPDEAMASGCLMQLVARIVGTIIVFAIGGLVVTLFDIDLGRRSVTIVGCGVVLGLMLLFSIVRGVWKPDEPGDPAPPKAE